MCRLCCDPMWGSWVPQRGRGFTAPRINACSGEGLHLEQWGQKEVLGSREAGERRPGSAEQGAVGVRALAHSLFFFFFGKCAACWSLEPMRSLNSRL